MSFDLYCPECKTKLRLDEQPELDTPIECPRCGSTFTPEESAPAPTKKSKSKSEKKAPADDGKKPKGNPKESKVREGMNPLLLLGIVAAGLVAYIAVAWVTLNILGKVGRVTDMMAYLPKDCTTARGANLKILSRYPGYKEEYDRWAVPAIESALTGLRVASGLEDEEAFTDYVLTGVARDGTVYAIRCREDFDPDYLAEGLKGQPINVGDVPCYRLPSDQPGILADAFIYLPTYRHVVVVRGPQALLGRSLAGYDDPKQESFVGGLTDAGEMAMGGHTWTITRDQTLISVMGLLVAGDKDLKTFAKAAAVSQELGAWNSFGGRIRYGAAIDCGDSDLADDLAKSLRESTYSKGDEAEFSREFKQAFPGSYNKEFRAFLSDISFNSSGTCAYYVSSVGGEGSIRLLQIIDVARLGAGGP